MYDHPELGGSLYDRHLDGSGVVLHQPLCGPMLNFAPPYHSWLGGHGSALYQYNADTHLFDWLDHKGVDYDVITDEDLHEDGLDLIRDYRVILTGTHPEYHSTQMWDAMKAWIDRGGRLMYIGGNGWYWRIAFHQTLPGVIELRRAEDGIRTWDRRARRVLSLLQRRIWRPMAPHRPRAQRDGRRRLHRPGLRSFVLLSPRAGCGQSPRQPSSSRASRTRSSAISAWSAAVRRGSSSTASRPQLGSPPNMLRLASSEDHSPMILLVNEEFGVVPPNLGGDLNPRVQADLAFWRDAGGRRALRHRLDRLVRLALAQQLRQQRLADHLERAATLP